MMIGAIAEGTTEVVGFSSAADPMSTLSCLRALGADADIRGQTLFVHGRGLRRLSQPQRVLDAGNSGTTIRLLTGILAGQSFASTISGDDSLSRRPMKRVIDPLTEMGARIEASENQTPPLKIFPVDRLCGVDYELPVPSAQVKSAILLCGLHAEGMTRVYERTPTRDHTERMLGLHVEDWEAGKAIQLDGWRKIDAKKFLVPGDISAATFFIVAACLVPNSELHITGVGLNPTRTAVLNILKEMGAGITIEKTKSSEVEPFGDVTVRSSDLQNVAVKPGLIPSIIDEIPALAIAGALANGRFEVRGASELRVKESDRVKSLCENLKSVGVSVEEYEDGFAFEGENELIPSGPLQSYGDHRIAMAMGVAGLVSRGGVEILGAECANISFPGFWDLLRTLTMRA